jgi:hypothetical protein
MLKLSYIKFDKALVWFEIHLLCKEEKLMPFLKLGFFIIASQA